MFIVVRVCVYGVYIFQPPVWVNILSSDWDKTVNKWLLLYVLSQSSACVLRLVWRNIWCHRASLRGTSEIHHCFFFQFLTALTLTQQFNTTKIHNADSFCFWGSKLTFLLSVKIKTCFFFFFLPFVFAQQSRDMEHLVWRDDGHFVKAYWKEESRLYKWDSRRESALHSWRLR